MQGMFKVRNVLSRICFVKGVFCAMCMGCFVQGMFCAEMFCAGNVLPRNVL